MVTHDPRYTKVADRTIHLFDGCIVDQPVSSEAATV
jgi:ABC-type lipoprotein export system ATPase subunit